MPTAAGLLGDIEEEKTYVLYTTFEGASMMRRPGKGFVYRGWAAEK